jgi:FixJ family two-component response regulator
MSDERAVSVVDDDESVRESLVGLLRSLHVAVQSFSSAEEFLAANAAARTECLILDVSLGGMDGTELQRILLESGSAPPIVVITARDDARVRQLVLSRGAVAYLLKPFEEAALLDAMTIARSRSA